MPKETGCGVLVDFSKIPAVVVGSCDGSVYVLVANDYYRWLKKVEDDASNECEAQALMFASIINGVDSITTVVAVSADDVKEIHCKELIRFLKRNRSVIEKRIGDVDELIAKLHD